MEYSERFISLIAKDINISNKFQKDINISNNYYQANKSLIFCLKTKDEIYARKVA